MTYIIQVLQKFRIYFQVLTSALNLSKISRISQIRFAFRQKFDETFDANLE